MINPNESWKDFFKSMVTFKEPELVSVSSLPPEQHPQNRRFNSVKYLVNWRGQNYHETWKPLPKGQDIPDSTIQIDDVEIEKFEN